MPMPAHRVARDSARLHRSRYAIYSFDAGEAAESADRWRRHETLDEAAAALSLAEKLYRTGQFRRVEIRRMDYDARRTRHLDTPYRVLGARDRSLPIPAAWTILAAIGAATAAIVAFALMA